MTTKNPLADEFAPNGYELPESNSFMKFAQGKNKFRILSSLVSGYEYWTADKKCVRSRTEFTETPDIAIDENGKSHVAHFWVLAVYNYAAESIQQLEITQKGIQKYILGLVNDKESWGNPKGYDLVVNREGEGMSTKYTVTANPPKEMPADILADYAKANINLESIFDEKE
jgi:hypothetical protein